MDKKSIIITAIICLLIIGGFTVFFIVNNPKDVEVPAKSEVIVTETVTEHKASSEQTREETLEEENDIDIDEGELERLMKDISIKTR